MNPMQPIPASQQVNQLREQLLQALIKKEEAQAQLDQANEAIKAIRNLLAGLPIGQKLAGEIAAEQAASAAQKPSLPEAPPAQ